MPHLTGLAATAATSTTVTSTATTAPGLLDGLKLWRDPVAAIKGIKDVGAIFAASPAMGLGYLLVPAAVMVVVIMSQASSQPGRR